MNNNCKILILLIFITLSVNCSKVEKVIINDIQYKLPIPPGTVQIDKNLFADKTEITNINYKEFLVWYKTIYGFDSKEYKKIIPDTTVWDELKSKNDPGFSKLYFQHPAYNEYPVVGVTLEQAKLYSKWRTERVTEVMLLNRKKIKRIENRSKNNFFTIERYKSGKLDWIIDNSELIQIPRYKIPNEEEWKFIAGGESSERYGIDTLTKRSKKCKGRNGAFFNTTERYISLQNYSIAGNSILKNKPAPAKSYCRNENELYNTIGNVSEIIDKEGHSKGGSWNHKLIECAIDKLIKFDKPNAWTGFRNICRWENSNEGS